MARSHEPAAIRDSATRAARGLLAAAVLAVALPLADGSSLLAQGVAAAPARELLNSERIEQTFGSYGIEVLESDGAVRVSNLYSEQGAERICRTFAVVRYPADVPPELTAEHETIVAGGSIGATFAARGWTVVKTHRYFGEVPTTSRLRALMGGTAADRLAVHVYALDVVKSGARYEYARIAEVHHPDYLDLRAVRRTYMVGAAQAQGLDDETRDLLELVGEKSR